jgi:hypothetical protein
MMEPFCGSAQANAKRVLYNLEETRASSNGQRTSVKKRKEKPKTASIVYYNLFPTIFPFRLVVAAAYLGFFQVSIEVAVDYC